jgi:Antibiotic biosynthesis monooxygenase
MTTINNKNECITLINVFTVSSPARQDDLIDILANATKNVIRFKKGFISANIHKSIDGVRVTNYGQWKTQEDLDAMRSDDVIPYMKKALEISKMDGHQYTVAFTDEK